MSIADTQSLIKPYIQTKTKNLKVILYISIHNPLIHKRSTEKDIHTKVKPDHHNNYRRQAPIHRKTTKIIHIHGNPKEYNVQKTDVNTAPG